MKQTLFSRMKSYQKVGMFVSVFTLTLLFFQNCNKHKSNLIDQSSVLDSKEYGDSYLNSSFASGEKNILDITTTTMEPVIIRRIEDILIYNQSKITRTLSSFI